MEHTSNDDKDYPNQHKNSHKLCNETAFSCEFDGKSMETVTTTWSEFPNGGKVIVEQIITSEKRNRSKRARLWKSQSEIQIGKLTIWVRSFEIQKL